MRTVIVAALVLATRPVVAQSGSKFCQLLHAADVAALLKTTNVQPPMGPMAGFECGWGPVPGKGQPATAFYISEQPLEKGHTGEQDYVAFRKEKLEVNFMMHVHDESGVGDRAFSYYQTQGLGSASFAVLTRGHFLVLWTMGTADVDALRPVVHKAIAAYVP
jgi:hypothetical protein